MHNLIEVCAGSVIDCKRAEEAKADRIELNSALHLGGLTPSLGMLVEVKKITDIPIISMVRPRGGGFHYNEEEKRMMFLDARYLILHGTEGLAFGFLNEDATIDVDNTKKMVELCHEHGAEAVFHRAFDLVKDPYSSIEILIECGVDRILTSGLRNKTLEGVDLLRDLKEKYGNKIEFVLGSGINPKNALEIIEKTGIHQLHASFKGWFEDPTSANEFVSYRYSDAGDYDGVDINTLKTMKEVLDNA